MEIDIMASAVHGVWAIDIGSNALKALQMRQGDEGLEVVDFAYLEHSQNQNVSFHKYLYRE